MYEKIPRVQRRRKMFEELEAKKAAHRAAAESVAVTDAEAAEQIFTGGKVAIATRSKK